MNASFSRLALLVVAALPLAGRVARADPVFYRVDILSGDRYPGVRDSWMFRINNQGVAAGYIATQGVGGPYLPATYSGGGRFQTFGLESVFYGQSVTGLNDRGDLVGTVFDKNFSQTPYIIRGGVVSSPNIPASFYPYMYGINNNGVAYGSYFDDAAGLAKVFTVTGDAVTPLPLVAPGFNNFDSGPRALTSSGLLGVIGYSDDFSITQPFVDRLATGVLTPLALPDGFPNFSLLKLAESGISYAQLFSADYSISRLGSWGADGAFLGLLDLPAGIDPSGVHFNDLGQAIGLLDGHAMFYDGSGWSERQVLGLDGYTLSSISDLNDRGDFVGLARNPAGTFEWGFVATAVPEPSSLALVGVAGLIGAAWRRTRAGVTVGAHRAT